MMQKIAVSVAAGLVLGGLGAVVVNSLGTDEPMSQPAVDGAAKRSTAGPFVPSTAPEIHRPTAAEWALTPNHRYSE